MFRLSERQIYFLMGMAVASTAIWIIMDIAYASPPPTTNTTTSYLEMQLEALETLKQQQGLTPDQENMILFLEQQIAAQQQLDLELQEVEQRLNFTEETIISPLTTSTSNMTVVMMDIFPNGTMLLHLDNNATLYLKHLWTPQQGYIFDNSTIYHPSGSVFLGPP